MSLIAYASGFFDGEGCISAERYRGRHGVEHRLRCITSQKFSTEPLLLMRELFGGNDR